MQTLARLFREHPAWVTAGRYLTEGASSRVFFSHRPDQRWHLVRRRGRSLLRPGAAPDPDLAFRFTPRAIDRLAAVEGGMADFALALFDLIAEQDEGLRVGLRVVAPFARLVRRGYLALLLAAGPRVLAYGLARGVRSATDLKRLIDRVSTREPEDWERV